MKRLFGVLLAMLVVLVCVGCMQQVEPLPESSTVEVQPASSTVEPVLVESAPERLAETTAQAVVPAVYPAPGLVEYFMVRSDVPKGILRYIDAEGNTQDVRLPHGKYSHNFASDTVLASVWKSQNSFYIATSHDNGGEWVIAELEGLEGDSPYPELGYANSTDGWVSVVVDNKFHIYKTYDGGKSWEELPTTGYQGIRGVQFASADVGWMVTKQPDYVLLETFDGGKTWARCDLPSAPEYYTRMSLRGYFTPVWDGYCWSIRLYWYWDIAYSEYSELTLRARPGTSTWVYAQEEWDLPAGIDPYVFNHFIFESFPPLEFDGTLGLAQQGHKLYVVDVAMLYFRLVPDAVSYNIEYIPARYVALAAEVLYGDANYSPEDYIEVDGELGYYSPPDGEHRSYGTSMDIVSVETTAEGNLRAVLKRSYTVLEPNVEYFYQECIYRPVLVEDVHFFTLLSSRLVDGPE